MKIDEGKGRRKREWGGKSQKKEPEVASHSSVILHLRQGSLHPQKQAASSEIRTAWLHQREIVFRAVDAAGIGIVLLRPWHRIHTFLSSLASLSCMLKQLLPLAHAENQIPNKVSLLQVTPLAALEGYS